MERLGGSGSGRSRLLFGDGHVESEVMVLLGLLEAFFATNRLGLRSDGFQDGSCDIGKQADSSCGDASAMSIRVSENSSSLR